MVEKRQSDRFRLEDIRRRRKRNDYKHDQVKRLNWLGHIQRTDPQSYVQTAYKEEFPGKRKKEDPKNTGQIS